MESRCPRWDVSLNIVIGCYLIYILSNCLNLLFFSCKIKSYSNLLSRRLTSKYENVKIKTLTTNIFISFITKPYWYINFRIKLSHETVGRNWYYYKFTGPKYNSHYSN